MVPHYLTIAFRSLRRNKLFSFINVAGLGIGLAACLLIVQYVSVEWSYDQFFPDAGSIYRIALDKYQEGGQSYQLATNYNALAGAVEENFPEVVAAGRAFPTYTAGNCIFSAARNGERVQFEEKQFFHADQGFLQVFTFSSLAGNMASALREPFTAVITRSTAAKYFGSNWQTEGNILDKTIRLNYVDGEHEYRVTAVIEDLPPHTHLPFNLLLSMRTYDHLQPEENFDQSWDWWDTFTYVRLRQGAEAKALEQKLPALLEQHKEKLGFTDRVKDRLFLQPLTSIHLHSHLTHEAQANGSADTVTFLLLIAAVILLLAWANYVNLTLAKSLYRTKEVGVRKVIGARRSQLFGQFVCESFLTYGLAISLAVGLVYVLSPLFGQLSGRPLSFSFVQNPFLWLTFAGCLITGTLLSGAYPAFVLSGAAPIRALKGMAARSRRFTFREGLLVLQFGLTAGLMVATLLIYRQYQYMQTRKLGMDIEQIVVINTPRVGFSNGTEEYVSGVNFFKNELKRQNGIRAVATSTTAPGREVLWGMQVRRETDPESGGSNVHYMGIDSDYITVFGLSLAAGRNFSPGTDYTNRQVMLNEAAASALGFETPESAIGQHIVLPGDNRQEVIGIVRNFNQLSLHRPYQPLYLPNVPYHNEFFFVKIQSGNLPETLASIERLYQQAFPGNMFSYFFQDEFFNRQYQAERQFARVSFLFTGLAIFIACMGLLGASSFATQQRTKEIGVRKVLGASVSQILLLLSKDFLKLVLVANLLAWPLAWWGTHQWLQNYAFRTDISPWLFVLPGLLLLLIALGTMSIHSWRAARTNPVESLRNE
jgi:putative ABC transport system permease protein